MSRRESLQIYTVETFYLVQSRVCFQFLVVGVLDVYRCISDLKGVAEERKTFIHFKGRK